MRSIVRAEGSVLMTKIRVKVGNSEVEIEAEQEHLKEAIDLVPELASKLPVVQGGTPIAVSPREGYSPSTASTASVESELPAVAIEKGDSLADVISKFFSDPWGRERRKLLDVREALQSYGLNYPKQSVAVALLRLAKTTKIRRFKADDGEYVYTAGTLVATMPPLQVEQTELEQEPEKLI